MLFPSTFLQCADEIAPSSGNHQTNENACYTHLCVHSCPWMIFVSVTIVVSSNIFLISLWMMSSNKYLHVNGKKKKIFFSDLIIWCFYFIFSSSNLKMLNDHWKKVLDFQNNIWWKQLPCSDEHRFGRLKTWCHILTPICVSCVTLLKWFKHYELQLHIGNTYFIGM